MVPCGGARKGALTIKRALDPSPRPWGFGPVARGSRIVLTMPATRSTRLVQYCRNVIRNIRPHVLNICKL